jgi:hypothetical protein
MRGRTLLAGTTLALLTLLWSAPAALAAPSDQDEPQPPTSAASDHPGSQQGSNKNQDRETETPTPTPKPPKPVQEPTTTAPIPKPAPHPAQPVQPPETTSSASAPAPAPAIVAPRAALSVSPKTVRRGESINANPSCQGGQVESISAPDVSFQGNTGSVGAQAAPGSRTVTLVCANGQEKTTATDTFQVVSGDGGVNNLRASLSVSPKVVRSGGSITANVHCENSQPKSLSGPDVDFNGTNGRVHGNAGDGVRTVTLVCADGPREVTATDRFQIWRDGPGGDPKAFLSVSPRVVKQGEFVYANGRCLNSQQESLTGDDVHFRGEKGWVDDNAREGEHTVRRVCRDGGKVDVATDTFRVIKGDSWNGQGPRDFWLSDRSGYRGDEIDLSVRCRDNSARVESDALDDVTLRRDGSRLTGTTHVEHDAKGGWHRVTVHCDGNTESRGFWVNRDRDHEKYLDLDPSYGHPGDEIDVNVGCDWSIGRLESDVLDDIELDRDGKDWRYHGTTHVEDDAEPGEHTVKIRCGDDTLEETFFVRGSDDNDSDDSPDGGEYVSVYPKGGVETGGGPVDNQPLGVVSLDLTSLSSASIAGIDAALARASERR